MFKIKNAVHGLVEITGINQQVTSCDSKPPDWLKFTNAASTELLTNQKLTHIDSLWESYKRKPPRCSWCTVVLSLAKDRKTGGLTANQQVGHDLTLLSVMVCCGQMLQVR